MSIATMCSHCETKFSLSDGLLGKRVRCKKCNAIFEVVESVVDAESAPTGMRSGSAPPRTSRPEAAARPNVRREDFDFEKERSRRRESSSGPGAGLIIGLSVGGGLLLLAIIGAVVWAFLPASPEPAPTMPPPVAANNPVDLPFQNLPRDLPNLPRDIPNVPNPLANLNPPGDGLPANADPITRAVAGLESDDVFTQSNAAKTLERTKVEEGRRAEVVEALKGVIDNRRPLIPRREAVRPLAAWGTKADTPYLVRLLDDDEVVDEVLIVLGKLKDASAAQAIVEKLPQHRNQASQALKDIGSVAEAAVVPLLNNPDNGVRIEACKILKWIHPTAISEQALVQAAEDDDQGVAQAARAALPANLRPPVYGPRQIIKICVVNGGQFPQLWPQIEAKFKALADSPKPKCKVSTSGDCKWVELTPINSDANTFARKINFGAVTAVHPDQRLIYVELR